MTDEIFLPPGTSLALGSGAQIVDAPARRVGSWLVYQAIIGGKPAWVREYFPERLVRRADDGAVVPAIEGPEAAAAWDAGRERAADLADRLRDLPAHPAIATVLDTGRSAGGTVLIATSRLDGNTTLEARIAADGRLESEAVTKLARQLAEGLAVLHDADMLHLDVRPQTVTLRGDQAVLDGFAIDERPYMAVLGSDKATLVHPPYSAVELYDNSLGESLAPSTDIYAASALLYTAMIGTPPPDWRDRIADDRLSARPSVKGYSAAFLEAIAVGMSLEPSAAFVTVESWRDALFAKNEAQPRKTSPLWWIVAAVIGLAALAAALIGSGLIDGPPKNEVAPQPSPTETSTSPTPLSSPSPSAPRPEPTATPPAVKIPAPKQTPSPRPTTRPRPEPTQRPPQPPQVRDDPEPGYPQPPRTTNCGYPRCH